MAPTGTPTRMQGGLDLDAVDAATAARDAALAAHVDTARCVCACGQTFTTTRGVHMHQAAMGRRAREAYTAALLAARVDA